MRVIPQFVEISRFASREVRDLLRPCTRGRGDPPSNGPAVSAVVPSSPTQQWQLIKHGQNFIC